MAKKQQVRVVHGITDWLERYLQVESVFLEKCYERFELPAQIDYVIKSVDEAERVAEDLRRAWELGFGPLDNLIELLEEKGIKVGIIKGFDSFDSCTLIEKNSGPVIVVKENLVGDRQRFDLAHELGHIVLQFSRAIDKEAAAHRFAASFLVPAVAARKELGNRRITISLFELHMLKHKYGFSMQGWIYRARDLGILPAEYANRMFRSFGQRGFRFKEPGDQLPSEEPKRMQRLIFRALSEQIITERRAAEVLGMPLDQFWREVGQAHGELAQ